MATKREDDQDFPAAAFAYVPDLEKPSTWKLRLWDSLDEKETARQIGMAVAALGKGFRGNKVQIPEADMPKVRARVLQAWLKAHPDLGKEDAPAVLKSSGVGRNEKGQFTRLTEAVEDAVSKEGRVLSRRNRDRVMLALDNLKVMLSEAIVPGEDDEETEVTDEYSKGGGMGYDMEYEDEEEDDALDLILDAYMAAIRRGPIAEPLVRPIMELAHDLEAVYRAPAEGEMEAARYMAKNGGGESVCPVEALLKAYKALLWMKGTEEIRKKVLDLIAEGDRILYAEAETMVEEMATMPIRRTIRSEDGKYVVYSMTGRKFGTYDSRTDAEARLRQIERFDKERLAGISPRQLAVYRANLRIAKATPANMTVAYLIDDRLDALPTQERLEIVKAANLEQRYTLGPVYVPGVEDAHGEFTDAPTLQKALWDWVKKGNRTIYLQHSDKPAGEMVEMMTMPWPVKASLTVPNQGSTDYTFPAETPFMGVVWEPWAWDMVKAGKLRGYSIGGRAKRVFADLPTEALKTLSAVTKHPGHADQAVHSPRKGGGAAPTAAPTTAPAMSGGGAINPGDNMDRKPNAEGTRVKVSGTVRGKGRRGVVTYSNRDGSYHNIEFGDGSSASYSGSDLTAI